MAPRVYIETSVISYLTSRPSRDLLLAARQEATREWWEQRDVAFLPCVSNLVLQEAARGDPLVARQRLELCRSLECLDISQPVADLARKLIELGAMPAQEGEDALHISLATIAQVDFIASWNFAHLVGPVAKFRLQTRIQVLGFAPPILATPEELLETMA